MSRRRMDAGILDGAALMEKRMPALRYVCRPWIAEGPLLLCAKPKSGKTTLIRQLVAAANTGGSLFGVECQKADVLFIELEESQALMQHKLRALGCTAESMRGVKFAFSWPRDTEGVSKMRDWLRQRPRGSTRVPLIVIDSFARFRRPRTAKGHAFTEDYDAVAPLADLCAEFPGLVVIVVHHTTKSTPEDPLDSISGTYGLSASTANYLVLLKQGRRYRLHAGGRTWNLDASDYEIRRESGGWELAGQWDFDEADLSPKQREAIGQLRRGPKTTAELASATGQSPQNTSTMMAKLRDERGLVVRTTRGWELAASDETSTATKQTDKPNIDPHPYSNKQVKRTGGLND